MTEKLTYVEAVKIGRLDEFAKTHEIKDPHPDSTARFNALFDALVVRGSPPDRRKSRKDSRADCSGTRTPSRTSQGASRKRGRVRTAVTN